MEFACSHVVCNWSPDGVLSESFGAAAPRRSVLEHQYDNRVAVLQPTGAGLVPPPLPRSRTSFQKIPPPPPPRSPRLATVPPHPPHPPLPPLPPPPPPILARGSKVKLEQRANVNVVSLRVGHLVDVAKAKGLQTCQSPVHCGKCSAAVSCLSSTQSIQDKTVWVCEFCGEENSLSVSPSSPLGVCVGGVCVTSPGGRDVLYLPPDCDSDYENLEDVLVVFCVDISGSMSVTTEVTPGNAMRSPTYVSRMQSIQDALQRALSSLLQNSPHRRVALVTFNDEVVVYGDGSTPPVTLRDWALVDYDHLWQHGRSYSTPHCIAESYRHLTQRVTELREHGATSLGPAALVSVAMASQYLGSKVVLCTDGRANIGLGEMEASASPSSRSLSDYFYRRLAHQAADSGVIVSVMTFEGTDCRLAEVGRLADQTGGRVNIVNIGTVATEIQTALADNILATGVIATLLAPDGVYFPYEEENQHMLVREIGNVSEGLEVTFQFAVKPGSTDVFLQRDRVPFQLQLSFKTREHQKMTRVISEQRRVTTTNWVWAGSLNMAVLGVHCAQLCARLTMEGRVQEAQRQLRAQQDLLTLISEQKPNPTEEGIYGNWIATMTTICEDLATTDDERERSKSLNSDQATHSSIANGLSDQAAKVVYQMKRARSVDQQTPQKKTSARKQEVSS